MPLFYGITLVIGLYPALNPIKLSPLPKRLSGQDAALEPRQSADLLSWGLPSYLSCSTSPWGW
jgi:hypothetical protein